ncbi:condensation domain protein [Richelia sinica FACHB-800]|uniref:Condensation domain protein n=1 Tax=Richelia sinica FACHB-800 TaxID=1357546 RepID=A0A975T9S1_9NOST|nr:condensation domain-containing protein [Richelia sinica]MBD2665602.1 TauD/TfdA family dioxygenase [Richelia sinica FACHB-800]QXE24828.1 condensation domain protein [Richelia sinica FACHB-800]
MNKKNIESIYPLSPSQLGMLFNTVSVGEKSGIYVEQLSCNLTGNLHLPAFEQAWQRVVARHSILRTAFVWKTQDEPRQVVFRQVEIKINYQDWRGQESTLQQQQLEEFLKTDRAQGFNLSKPPLMRLAILHLRDDSYHFVWSHHHILIDGWCLFLLFKELLSFYQAIAKNQAVHIPPTRPYQDYITWLKQQNLETANIFWQKTLQGFTQPTALGLPVGDETYRELTAASGKKSDALSATTTATLQSLVKQNRITFNTLIQGIWALLLNRYSNHQDVIFGITVAGRPVDLVGSESMVGLFINTLPLRISITPDFPLWSWLQNIYTLNLELREYEHISTGQIYQCSQLPGGVPLYESLLVFENYPLDYSILQSPNLDIHITDICSQGAQTQYPLTILVSVDSECKFSLIYDQRRFDDRDIDLILSQWVNLLQFIAHHPDINLETLLAKIPIEQIPHIRPRCKQEQTIFHQFLATPQTPVEAMVSQIWTKILGLPQIDIHENFFNLGGHSLLATQVISQIRQVFQLELPLGKLFEFPTIAGFSKEIEQIHQKQSQSKLPPLVAVNRTEKIPLSYAQERLWLVSQLQANDATYNELFTLRLTGFLNIEALEHSLNEIVHRHEALRTSFYTDEHGQPFQAIAPNVKIKLSILELSHLSISDQDGEIQHLINQEYHHPFDLSQVPLLRCTLLRIHEQEHIVLFSIHHIVSDGWSMGVLTRELAALYTAFSANKLSPLPPLPIQYADFAVWQRQYLQGERKENLLTYWQQQLANLPALQLPTTHPRGEVKTNRGASYSFLIPNSLVQEVQLLSQQAGVTLFMTLLASFKILLQRYSHQDDIVVGTDVANRNHTEIEQLIGFFINLLVLRTDLSGNPTFLDLLQRIRHQTLAAYAHQDLPFDELVRALQPERHLSNQVPLFQVLFVLQNTPNSVLELPGLALNSIEVESGISRFDLALLLRETDSGITGKWQYNADLFTTDTITQFTNHWQTLLNSIVTSPHSRINTLEMLTTTEKRQKNMEQQERKAAKRQKFMSIAPQPVNLSVEQLIKTDYLPDSPKFPLVIQPHSPEVDLIFWAENNREYLQTKLFTHGAILFRDFPVKSVAEFENFAQTICPNLFAEYGDLPRTGEGGNVYGSTPYPADKAILFHNESSHLHCFPLKIWFYCVQPATKGGETPIVECRKAYKLLSPQLREKLATKQLMYVRNFAEGLDVSWQNFFRTTNKKDVENYCIQAGIDFEWYDDNGLVTRQIRPALAIHPQTGEPVFFNQIQLHHISYLDVDVRDSLLSLFGESKLPRNVYFGDSTPITAVEIAEINQVYQQSQTSFSWQKGDIIMLDNMLTAHGRNPFVGERKIVVAMGEMTNGSDIKNIEN